MDRVAQLSARLQALVPEISAEDVADALWLAIATAPATDPSPSSVEIIQPVPTQPSQRPSMETALDWSAMARPAETPVRPTSPHLSEPAAPDGQVPVYPFFTRSAAAGTNGPGRALQPVIRRALPNPLALGRALRPLRRRVGVPTHLQLDETSTAGQIAASGGRLWIPVWRVAQTRWLDVVLVVDVAPSMVIWRQTAAELRAVLERQGAFRDVRVWSLSSGHTGRAAVWPGLASDAEGRRSDPRTLANPNGKRLFLVLSDAVGVGWRDGSVAAMLTHWASYGPVVLLQVLPEQLWGRSALGGYGGALLRAPFEGAPNIRLSVELLEEWRSGSRTVNGGFRRSERVLPLPVASLAPDDIGRWAAMVAGGLREVAYGVVIDGPVPAGPPPPPSSSTVQLFRVTASASAQRLAGLLAAAIVPLTLAEIDTLRRTLIPEAETWHVAEVLLSGLLRPAETARTEGTVYSLIDEAARDRLLNPITQDELAQVLSEVEPVARRLTDVLGGTGRARDFRAVVADPQLVIGLPISAEARPIAIVLSRVLRRYGGEYQDLAHALDQALVPAPYVAPLPSAMVTSVPEPNTAQNLQTPFVGRHDVVLRLKTLLSRVTLGGTRVYQVIGKGGIGKSFLLKHLPNLLGEGPLFPPIINLSDEDYYLGQNFVQAILAGLGGSELIAQYESQVGYAEYSGRDTSEKGTFIEDCFVQVFNSVSTNRPVVLRFDGGDWLLDPPLLRADTETVLPPSTPKSAQTFRDWLGRVLPRLQGTLIVISSRNNLALEKITIENYFLEPFSLDEVAEYFSVLGINSSLNDLALPSTEGSPLLVALLAECARFAFLPKFASSNELLGWFVSSLSNSVLGGRELQWGEMFSQAVLVLNIFPRGMQPAFLIEQLQYIFYDSTPVDQISLMQTIEELRSSSIVSVRESDGALRVQSLLGQVITQAGIADTLAIGSEVRQRMTAQLRRLVPPGTLIERPFMSVVDLLYTELELDLRRGYWLYLCVQEDLLLRGAIERTELLRDRWLRWIGARLFSRGWTGVDSFLEMAEAARDDTILSVRLAVAQGQDNSVVSLLNEMIAEMLLDRTSDLYLNITAFTVLAEVAIQTTHAAAIPEVYERILRDGSQEDSRSLNDSLKGDGNYFLARAEFAYGSFLEQDGRWEQALDHFKIGSDLLRDYNPDNAYLPRDLLLVKLLGAEIELTLRVGKLIDAHSLLKQLEALAQVLGPTDRQFAVWTLANQRGRARSLAIEQGIRALERRGYNLEATDTPDRTQTLLVLTFQDTPHIQAIFLTLSESFPEAGPTLLVLGPQGRSVSYTSPTLAGWTMGSHFEQIVEEVLWTGRNVAPHELSPFENYDQILNQKRVVPSQSPDQESALEAESSVTEDLRPLRENPLVSLRQRLASAVRWVDGVVDQVIGDRPVLESSNAPIHRSDTPASSEPIFNEYGELVSPNEPESNTPASSKPIFNEYGELVSPNEADVQDTAVSVDSEHDSETPGERSSPRAAQSPITTLDELRRRLNSAEPVIVDADGRLRRPVDLEPIPVLSQRTVLKPQRWF